MADSLDAYREKRDFAATSEPRGEMADAGAALSFVVQKHAASQLHYDFRLELDGALKSWAVPKGPSLDPAHKRMAVQVEDHPLAYARFEGAIPPGQYGAGNVIVWDRGTWEPVGDPREGYRAGKLKFRLHGEKLLGGWALVRMHGREHERQPPWLLIKERDEVARSADEYDLTEALPASVLSGKPLEASAPRRKAARGAAASAASATQTAAVKTVAAKMAKPTAVGKTAAKTATAKTAAAEATATRTARANAAKPKTAKAKTATTTTATTERATKKTATKKTATTKAAATETAKAKTAASAATTKASGRTRVDAAPARTARSVAGPTSALKADRASSRSTPTRPSAKAARSAPNDKARAAPMPESVSPQLATLVTEPPSTGSWSYEIKFDGYRILARIEDGEVRLLTRNANDWTDRLGGIAGELAALKLASAWIDGEIVVLNDAGASDFAALQNAFESGGDAIVFYAFDLLYADGHDLRDAPIEDRRSQLASMLDGAGPRVRFSQDFQADASDVLHQACHLRLEGVIGKRLGSPYVSRRSPDWIKLKCTSRQEFVIGGYTEPKGSRVGLGALLLGIHDERGRLRFAGSVGTGFDTRTLAALRKQLAAIETPQTPFFDKPREARGTWVAPELVAEVSFAEWTHDGKVRHAVFHGLRTDKPPRAITRERAVPAPGVTKTRAATATAAATKPTRSTGTASTPSATASKTADAPSTQETTPTATRATAGRTRSATARGATPAAGAAAKRAGRAGADTGGSTAPGTTASTLPALPAAVRVTNPQRVIDPESQRTKRDLVDHYLRAARRMLPHLARRPVALLRAPSGLEGTLFFQKHAGSLRIAEIRELPQAFDPEHPPLLAIDTFTALISAAQMNVVEFHTWNATTRAIEKPDRMTFDLDPGEGIAWPDMVRAATLVRALLEELGLRSFLKTSGGKGLHVVVPLTPREGWDEVKAFSRGVVELLAAAAPDTFVAKSGPKNRVGRIFADYLRNSRGATTVAAYSARARPGLGVSVPCAWEELPDLTGGDHWNTATVHERLELAEDPWADYTRSRQTLVAARKALAARHPS